jgi:hypothetical protein
MNIQTLIIIFYIKNYYNYIDRSTHILAAANHNEVFSNSGNGRMLISHTLKSICGFNYERNLKRQNSAQQLDEDGNISK